MPLRRWLPVLLLAAGPASIYPAWAGAEQQAVVDRSTLTVQELLGESEPAAAEDGRSLLRRARAVMVCPRVFRAGFIFGAEGGDCVLVARDAAGSWSSPAFYGIASGSVGLQIGIQDAQILMLIMTDRGLNAVMDSQFKIGADISLALLSVGAGLEGSTTAAAGADIVALARARGIFAGVALEGSLLTSRSGWNRDYYGQDLGPRQIVVAMQAHNPGADPLRGALSRYGAAVAAAPAQTAHAAPVPVAPAQAMPAPGAVQSTPLPPIAGPRR